MHELWHDLWAPAIAATLGTAAGAALAFWLDRHNRAVRIEDERVTATNTAIFALVRIWNDLDAYRRQEIEERRNRADRWYTLRPTPLPEPVAFDAASLAYLFELGGDAPTLPMEVDLELGKYVSLHVVATERNRIHEQEAQPAMEVTERSPVARPLEERLISVFGGSRVIVTLQGLTDDLIKMTDISLASIPVVAEKLRNVAIAQHPKRKIIQFTPIEPGPNAQRLG